MKAFHALLTSLYRVQPPPGADPLPPSEVLGAWNTPAGPGGSGRESELTIWGAFLAEQELVQGDNPVIWSTVNTSHFDRTKQIFRSDHDVRNSFPVYRSDQNHVSRVHDVGPDTEARKKFLSASYIAEGLEKAKTTDYLSVPWLLARDITGFSSAQAVTIALDKQSSNKLVAIKHPRKPPVDLKELLTPQNGVGIVSRYTNYIHQITLPNTAGKHRTACCLLRVPAGQIATNYHLIEFFHAFSKLPSEALVEQMIAATEIAACAIQSVMAPTIIREVESTRSSSFFNDVIAHDVDNWRMNVAGILDNLRDSLPDLRLSQKAHRTIGEHLDFVESENEIFHAVLQGISWASAHSLAGGLEPVNLEETVTWVGGIRHAKLKQHRVCVHLEGTTSGVRIPGETNIVVANLIRNAIKANQSNPPAEIKVTVAVLSTTVTISVASAKPFDLLEWQKQQPEDQCPREHRGLWLCRQMLKSLNSEIMQVTDKDKDFGCVLRFSTPTI